MLNVVSQLKENENLREKVNRELEQKVNERTKELKQANVEILNQRNEIESQRDKVTEQKEEIEFIHHEISSSIDYAERLQKTILSDEHLLTQHISDHFVLLLPKDKVSGDFYWWNSIENNLIVAAADCTGHGVPGAFMSMLSVALLREIITKEYITHSGVILNKMRKEIIRTLGQKGEIGEQKDGLDIALISINLDTKICQFSGANNPLYLIRRGELIEYKGDRMPIAIHYTMERFKTYDIPLEKGDQLYMFSDGFADQFGGEKGKKFKYKAFKNLLLSISENNMTEQKKKLNSSFKAWCGNLAQIDDVLIIGLKIE